MRNSADNPVKVDYFVKQSEQEERAHRILSARATAKTFRLASLLIALASIVPLWAIISNEMRAGAPEPRYYRDYAPRAAANNRLWSWLWVASAGSSASLYCMSLHAKRTAEKLRKPY